MTRDIRDATAPQSTVIIGAGLAGLVCGNLLADRGHEVVILESNDEPGGRARTDIHDGFHCNFGPHAVYDDGALAELLDDLDVPVTGGAPEGPMFGLRGGDVERLPEGPWSILTSSLLGFRSTFTFMSLMTTLQSADPAVVDGTRSAADWLDEHAGDGETRQIAEAFIRLSTYAADMEAMPADIMLDSLQRATAGVTYLDGGWQRVVDGLADRLRERGGHLACGAPVTDVARTNDETSEARFRVGLRGAEPVTARRVVLATPPRAGRRILGAELADRAEIPAEFRPVEAACLDLALDQLPRPDRPLALGFETPTYISDHGLYADLAPEEATVVHAARYLRPGESLDADRARADIETALDTLQPGWRDHFVRSRYLSRMPVISHMPSPDEGGFAGRPSPVVDDVSGLYLAGDWVGECGWLSNASAASARRVAETIGEHSHTSTTPARKTG